MFSAIFLLLCLLVILSFKLSISFHFFNRQNDVLSVLMLFLFCHSVARM